MNLTYKILYSDFIEYESTLLLVDGVKKLNSIDETWVLLSYHELEVEEADAILVKYGLWK